MPQRGARLTRKLIKVVSNVESLVVVAGVLVVYEANVLCGGKGRGCKRGWRWSCWPLGRWARDRPLCRAREAAATNLVSRRR